MEATFELRFSSTEPQAGDLLPGLLYPKLRDSFPTVSQLPFGQVPRIARTQDPKLAYQAINALTSQSGHRVYVGDKVAGVTFVRPYPGWAKVRPKIEEVLAALANTGIIRNIERVSLKYVNLLDIGASPSLDILDVSASLGNFSLKPSGTQIRAEIERGGYLHIVQVLSKATATRKKAGNMPAESATGVVVDVDTIRMGPIEDPWVTLPKLLEEIHEAEKEVFFGLLRKQTLESMEPIYVHEGRT